MVKMRHEGRVENRAIYVAIGIHAVDRMLGDHCQDCAQVEGRIEFIQLGCSDEAVQRCSTLAAGITAAKTQ